MHLLVLDRKAESQDPASDGDEEDTRAVRLFNI
jgi:hypothetical protein